MIIHKFQLVGELIDSFAEIAEELEGNSGVGFLEEISDNHSPETAAFMEGFLDECEKKYLDFFFEFVEVKGNQIEWGLNTNIDNGFISKKIHEWLIMLGATEIETDFRVE